MNFKNLLQNLLVMLICLSTLVGSQLEATSKKKRVKPCTPTYTIAQCPHSGGVSFPIFLDNVQTTGTVTISDTETELQLSVDVSSTPFLLRELQVFAAAYQSSCDVVPVNPGKNPKVHDFPFSSTYTFPVAKAQFPINFSDIPCFQSGCDQNIHMVVALKLYDPATGKTHTSFASGSSCQCWSGARWGYCLVYQLCCANTTAPQVTVSVSGGDDTICTGSDVIVLSTTTQSCSTTIHSMQWQLNGQNISGANEDSLSLTDVQTSDTGTYTLVVTDSCGNQGTGDVTLTVQDCCVAPVIQSFVVPNPTPSLGDNVTFTVTATGASLSYEWYLNDVQIIGAMGNTLTLNNVSPIMDGQYSVQVTNGCGSPISSEVLLTVTPSALCGSDLPTIHGAVSVVSSGSQVTFSVNATSNNPNLTTLYYQWYFQPVNSEDLFPIYGANADQLVIDNPTSANTGTYYVSVSEGCNLINDAFAQYSAPAMHSKIWKNSFGR